VADAASGSWTQYRRLENVVALCDVNDQKLAGAFQRWERQSRALASSPHDWERGAADIYKRILESRPRTFHDFRELLDKMKEIDAVIVPRLTTAMR